MHDEEPEVDMDDDDRGPREALLAEYQTITRQIIHWDTFFWTKSRFFLAVEGIALLASADRLLPNLKKDEPLVLATFWVLLGIVLLNWFLCGVWFLTGRRNREFLTFRFERGYEIENHPVLRDRNDQPLIRLYHHQDSRLASPELKGKFSHYWEISMPLAFFVAWFALLAVGIWLLKTNWCKGLAGSLVAILLGSVILWLYDRYQKKSLPPETRASNEPLQRPGFAGR